MIRYKMFLKTGIIKFFPTCHQIWMKWQKAQASCKEKRGIGCAVDLLRMLFLYASSNFSFRILAVAACTLGISNISDTAWRKQFSKAAPFLHKILQGMLSSLLPAVDASCFAGVKQVLLVDTSVIRQQGETTGTTTDPPVLFSERKPDKTSKGF